MFVWLLKKVREIVKKMFLGVTSRSYEEKEKNKRKKVVLAFAK